MPLGRVRPSGMRLILAILLTLLATTAQADVCTQIRYYFSGWAPGGTNPPTNWVRATDHPTACVATGGSVEGGFCRLPTDPGSGGGGTSQLWSPESRTGDYCPADQCAAKAGKITTQNFTTGWTTEPGKWASGGVGNVIGDWTGPVPSDEVCINSCTWVVLPNGQGYTSMEASPNGMHRMSVDYRVNGMGTTCIPKQSDKAADPATPDPACPGTKGFVNGKAVCLAAAPSTPLPTPSNPASAPQPAPMTPGNPAAGEKPATGSGAGDGPGRTPVTGNGPGGAGGTNAGGSSSAVNPQNIGGTGTGGAGSGTPDDPYRAKDPCGLPGTPACKLDESGTPGGQGTFDAQKSAVEAASMDRVSKINGSSSAYASVGWSMPGWLPSVSCTAISMWGPAAAGGSWTVDPCTSPGVAIWRALLGWVLAVLTVMYAWHSLRDIKG